jgi:hypothetical protein
MKYKYLFLFRPNDGTEYVPLKVKINAASESDANKSIWGAYFTVLTGANYFAKSTKRPFSDFKPPAKALIKAIEQSKYPIDYFLKPFPRKCFLLDSKTDEKLYNVADPNNIPIGIDDAGLYGFIHPTKTGGTSFLIFVEKYLKFCIAARGHQNTSSSILAARKMPIMFVRDPVDRFVSIFRYWRFGSDSYQRPANCKPGADDIHQFIAKYDSLDIVDPKCDWFYHAHLRQQSSWLARKDWDKTFIVRYSRGHLHENIFELLSHIGLADVVANKSIATVNVTAASKQLPGFSEKELSWIRSKYKLDFELWDAVNNHPNKFKGVFGKL